LDVVGNNLKKMCGSGRRKKYSVGNAWKLIVKETQVRAWAVEPVQKKKRKKKKKRKRKRRRSRRKEEEKRRKEEERRREGRIKIKEKRKRRGRQEEISYVNFL
jgi:hypothetical protein